MHKIGVLKKRQVAAVGLDFMGVVVGRCLDFVCGFSA